MISVLSTLLDRCQECMHACVDTHTHILHQHGFQGWWQPETQASHCRPWEKPAHSCCFGSWPGLSAGSSPFLFMPFPVPPRPRQAQSVTSFPLLGVPWGILSQRPANSLSFYPGNTQQPTSGTGHLVLLLRNTVYFLKHRKLPPTVLKSLRLLTTSTGRHSPSFSTACCWVSEG